jgi:hypothetical protein
MSSNKNSTAGGSSPTLRADVRGTDTTFLRFDLSSLAGKTVLSATLRVHSGPQAWAGSNAVFDLMHVVANDWKEAWLSYNNTVPISNVRLGVLQGARSPNTWYSAPLDVNLIQQRAGKLLSMAVTGRTGDVLIFNSREAGPQAPQLYVYYK